MGNTVQELIELGQIDPDHWLADARVLGESIRIENGHVVWEHGTWKGGTWKGGTWKGGTWEGGTWKTGYWEDGYWKDGYWEDGIWKTGYWEDGYWKVGTWEGGTWEGGTWKGGTWEGGTWEGGYWKDGFSSITRCRWSVYIRGDKIRIGCEERTIEEWDKFFASDEVLYTERGTEDFELIHKAYKAAKYRLKLDKPQPNKED